jgi:Fe-coproporphyrin III synthase
MGLDPALAARGLRIAWENPLMLPTLVRMEYRHRLGIPRDRRLHAGYSAPPTNLAMVLTLRCNLNCVMCRQIRSDHEVPQNRSWYDGQQELPLQTWIDFLDQTKSFLPWLYLTGGEPLVYPHFRELVTAARQRRLTVHLQTNGTLLNQVAEFLVKEGVVAVSISLDGPPAIHDTIRGVKGTFTRVAKGVGALLAARKNLGRPNPIVSFNCTISKGNLDYLADMVPLAAELGADALQIQHTMFNSPEKVACHNAYFTPERVAELGLDMAFPSVCAGEFYQSEIGAEDLPQLKEALRQARDAAKGRLLLTFLPSIPEDLLEPYYLNLDHPFQEGCNFFWKTLRISPDGTCSPCLNFRVGNIREQSFPEIWNGSRMRSLRQFFSNSLVPGCARCCQRHYTKGSRAF